MPYGPGKFEGEPASTFFVYKCILNGGTDDDNGEYSLIEGCVYPGADSLDAALAVGYTEQEISDSCSNLANMAGAIMHENDQGFVHVDIYDEVDSLREDWQTLILNEG